MGNFMSMSVLYAADNLLEEMSGFIFIELHVRKSLLYPLEQLSQTVHPGMRIPTMLVLQSGAMASAISGNLIEGIFLT